MTSLDLRDVSVAYGDKMAVHGVTLRVAPGEILALIGPNGAGKTSLIRAISGVLPLRLGSILVADTDLASLSTPERARLVAVVPQARVLGGAFTVEQTVLLGRTPHLGWLGRTGEHDLDIVHRALEQVGATHLAQRRIAELSGGEQQRVLLARALAQDTPILLLDEPTAHLDLQHQGNLLRLVRELARDKLLAVLMAMHDLNLVSLYTDRVALLVDGELLADGLPAAVLTEVHLRPAYGADIQVIPHPENGAPLIFPVSHRQMTP